MGVLLPVLLTLDTFSSSAAFLVHLFFSLPALPPKQFTYFPDITRASLCVGMQMLHLMDEIVQQRGQKLDGRRPSASNINVFTQQNVLCSSSPLRQSSEATGLFSHYPSQPTRSRSGFSVPEQCGGELLHWPSSWHIRVVLPMMARWLMQL